MHEMRVGLRKTKKMNLRMPKVMFLADPRQVLPHGGRCAARCFSRLQVVTLRRCQPFGQAARAQQPNRWLQTYAMPDIRRLAWPL